MRKLADLIMPRCADCDDEKRKIKVCVKVADLTNLLCDVADSAGDGQPTAPAPISKADALAWHVQCAADLVKAFPENAETGNLKLAVDKAKDKLSEMLGGELGQVKEMPAKAAGSVQQQLSANEMLKVWPEGFTASSWKEFAGFATPIFADLQGDALTKSLSDMCVAMNRASVPQSQWQGFMTPEQLLELTDAKAIFGKGHCAKLEGFCLHLLVDSYANPISIRKRFASAMRESQEELAGGIEGFKMTSSLLHPMIQKQLEQKSGFSGAASGGAKAKAKEFWSKSITAQKLGRWIPYFRAWVLNANAKAIISCHFHHDLIGLVLSTLLEAMMEFEGGAHPVGVAPRAPVEKKLAEEVGMRGKL
ncbi:unnamed protein product [Prorocentrum cordatum]|uniref:Uncharacterized protein n=1 Tax=Prorocentrum cordatum TaxID=2364126 RepID=A0ABN9TT36_9DINO|nr:unnamed protein product [Polarella glacialis]